MSAIRKGISLVIWTQGEQFLSWEARLTGVQALNVKLQKGSRRGTKKNKRRPKINSGLGGVLPTDNRFTQGHDPSTICSSITCSEMPMETRVGAAH
jgi:hypothetical protein